MLIRLCFLYVLTGLAVLAPALAQTAYERSGAAIVIFIDAASQPNILPFDELPAGRIIPLNKGESLELGYFESCVMEAITGGAVTIGARESRVKGGTIQRETVDCANMRFQHGIAQLQFAAAAVFEKSDGPAGSEGAGTGAGDVVSWSGSAPAVPDQHDVLVGPLLKELDRPRRIAVLPVAPVAGLATREAAAGARNHLVARLRAETDHILIADDQLKGLPLAPGDPLDDRARQRLRVAGAEVVVACAIDHQGDGPVLGCEAQMVDGDVVVGHGAVLLPSGTESDGGTTAIVD